MSNSVVNVLCGKLRGCFFKAPPNNSNVQSGLWAIVLHDDKWQNYFSLDWQLFALSLLCLICHLGESVPYYRPPPILIYWKRKENPNPFRVETQGKDSFHNQDTISLGSQDPYKSVLHFKILKNLFWHFIQVWACCHGWGGNGAGETVPTERIPK